MKKEKKEVKVKIEKVLCTRCNGTGKVPYSDEYINCPQCKGKGKI